ncbi:polysaccharide biosynthesis/export family protein [Flavobacterium sp. HXWNR69]|uniref:Polysaccharide biosynthesis/export family protein n=1 Tax=Flavobacterium fragile TaxID=2949085 RepID=A0ABT0TFG1_9FLAO|nr:polysaccharide biosynthesis/export family protein [Flavobacterium sp. HXWNR69]MCL9769717.1 polysaccharide biosynthesis/export family protein [Flavobacterium sp. HXWNR69]
MRTKIVLLTSLFVGVLLTGCVSKSKIVYLNGINNSNTTIKNVEIKLQPDDILLIVVTSENPEITLPYNLKTLNVLSDAGGGQQQRQMTYLIDKKGEINFPILGNINIGGLTRLEAQEKIQNILKEHVSDAKVDIRIQNFKVTVLGEVMRPGTINVTSERITVLEALGMVGDLGIQGKRDNILLIREQNGQSITQRLDLRDPNLINSPFYYLVQNDVLYVEPNKTKINSSGVGPNLTVGLTALSLLIGIISLTIR